MNSTAQLALAEFKHRKAAFDDAVNHRGYPREKAERALLCWFSIALSCGVPPGELGALVEHWQAERDLTDSWARHILLWQGPPEAEWHTEFRRAAAHARARMQQHPGDPDHLTRHLTLDCLAVHLGLRADPEREAEPQRKAA